MSTKYHLTLRSANVKTGPIPVSTTSSDTCPSSCGQFQTCYAKGGPLMIHWRKLDQGERGMPFRRFLGAVRALPDGQLWRHNQAGDLCGKGESINVLELKALVNANQGRKGFTYTHKPLTRENASAIRYANRQGFTVNVSADCVADADVAKRRNVGLVVVVLPKGTREGFLTPAGNRVVLCPVITHEDVSCATCKLCAWRERDVIIGFPAHGSKASQVPVDKLVRIVGA